MRGLALSDLHLGFRAFAATASGRNAREVDVERAWMEAVRLVAIHRPDLVTIAGDVVHHPRVGSHAVKALRDGLRQISEAGIPVVIIQGNHDAGKTAEILTPIVIPDDLPGIHVVREVARLRLRAASTGELVSVTCMPFTALQAEEVTWDIQTPDAGADVNILLVHAPVNTSAEDVERLPTFYAGADSLDVGRLADVYDVIAAGDFHEFRRLHPTRLAFYSGSIERTSSNIWDERAPKGGVLYDTAESTMELLEVSTREVFDCRFEEIRNGAPTAAAVNEVLQERVECHPEGCITRLRVEGLPYSEKAGIDFGLVRQLKERCLHFQLDVTCIRDEAAAGDRRERGVRSLLDEARDFFADDEPAVRELAVAHLVGEEVADAA